MATETIYYSFTASASCLHLEPEGGQSNCLKTTGKEINIYHMPSFNSKSSCTFNTLNICIFTYDTTVCIETITSSPTIGLQDFTTLHQFDTDRNCWASLWSPVLVFRAELETASPHRTCNTDDGSLCRIQHISRRRLGALHSVVFWQVPGQCITRKWTAVWITGALLWWGSD